MVRACDLCHSLRERLLMDDRARLEMEIKKVKPFYRVERFTVAQLRAVLTKLEHQQRGKQ